MSGKVGRYEVVGHLAQGGMAEILLGRQIGPRGFEQAVVIKRILPTLARAREFVDMFTDEASILAAVRHPNVVTVHEFGREGDDLFLVLEYLEGESVGSLARRLWTRGEEIDRRLGAYIIAEACAGLHAAHELTDDSGAPRDLVHRDVSPQNVLVTYSGQVKILDFGIAKAHKRHAHTEAGQLKGKAAYMSPEQCHGKPLDRRSDVFALGTLLYELTTSRRLFRRESELDTLKAITEEPVTPPSSVIADYPAALEAICMRALSRKRTDRYETAADMRRDLLAAIHRLDGERLPEEGLARRMQQVFGDRIAEKRELLRKVRAGSGVEHIPEAEADALVELPTIDDHKTLATRATFTATAPVGRSRSGFAIAAVAVAAGFGLWWLIGAQPRAQQTTAEAVQAPLAEKDSAVAPTNSVTVHIDASPSGATVLAGGVDHGRAPVITLPRGSAPILIEVRHDGFESWKEEVVPDVDQRLVVNLRPRPAAAPPRAAPKPEAPKPATSTAPPAPPPPYEKM